MDDYLVLAVIGDDRPGLVESLAQTIAAHDGNWLESRMSHLAGKFAGVLRVRVPRDRTAGLREALAALERDGLRVIAEDGAAERTPFREGRLSLIGSDQPGIVREISTVLARHRVNVEELTTAFVDAPMSGQPLFKADARLELPGDLTAEDLGRDLEAVAQDLMVEVTVVEESGDPGKRQDS
jgi:glycine cleavage system regulatory protein